MALRLEDKKALVAEVNEVAARAQSVVAAEYRGLSVAQITDLRAVEDQGLHVTVPVGRRPHHPFRQRAGMAFR